MVIDALKTFELPLETAHAFARVARSTEGDRITLNIARSRAQLEQIESYDGDVKMLSQMLGDTLEGLEQMGELVENLRDFTRLDREECAYAGRKKMPVSLTDWHCAPGVGLKSEQTGRRLQGGRFRTRQRNRKAQHRPRKVRERPGAPGLKARPTGG